MLATQHGSNEIVQLLLERGADPRPQGSHGLSAPDFARQNDHAATLRLLEEATPD